VGGPAPRSLMRLPVHLHGLAQVRENLPNGLRLDDE
jgi:hypothetical protein